MKRKIKERFGKVLSLALCFSMLFTQATFADSVDPGDTYVSLGADLTDSEQETVLELLGIDDLDEYNVEYITNAQEHEYLDDYLEQSVIGSKALSSVIVHEGSDGINVETHNITFCTSGMYRNALATAGMENAEVVVAGPYNISGTAALVGAMKAYESMTGETVSEENLDAANEELVTTGELADSIGEEEAEELVALVKDKVVSDDLDSEEEIEDAIDESAEELSITLSDEDKEQIAELMAKISDLDLDADQLKEQAQGIYDKLEDIGVSLDETNGILDKIAGFFSDIKDKLLSFFDDSLIEDDSDTIISTTESTTEDDATESASDTERTDETTNDTEEDTTEDGSSEGSESEETEDSSEEEVSTESLSE